MELKEGMFIESLGNIYVVKAILKDMHKVLGTDADNYDVLIDMKNIKIINKGVANGNLS